MKRIDTYIIRKYLGTFFLSIVLVMSLAIVFDLTENMDDFFENQVPVSEIVFDYYLNFIPYYMNMFAPLFIFISVIFFTSKLAGNSEIIAMLAAGISFKRLLLPYMLSATLLFAIFFYLGGYVIPPSNGKLLDFQDKYVQRFKSENARNVQMMVTPGTILYIETFQKRQKSGYRASLDHFEHKHLTSRIVADRIYFDGVKPDPKTGEGVPYWHFENYIRRDFDGLQETLSQGRRFDTIIPMVPEELFITQEQAQQMTNPELRRYIEKQRARGTGNIQAFETELHKRYASPIGVFIMTLLAVTMSARKVRGGMGKNLGIGITLSAAYILFSTISTTFSVNGVMSPFMSVWLPNFIFLAVSAFLYTRAPK